MPLKAILIKLTEVIALIAILLFILFYFGFIRFNYPSKIEYPIRGIDISHHQGDINWEKLKTEKIDFIYIKATEGASFVDHNFKENWKNASKNKYKVGAYHFYLACSSGSAQAKNFIQTVPENPNSLPPVIDLEFNNCKTNKSKSQILKEINDFVVIIKNHYHVTPIIYTTNIFYNDILKSKMPPCKIWIRSIFCHPKMDKDLWVIWQYSDRGRIKGIKNYVDLNVIKINSIY